MSGERIGTEGSMAERNVASSPISSSSSLALYVSLSWIFACLVSSEISMFMLAPWVWIGVGVAAIIVTRAGRGTFFGEVAYA